MCNLPRLRRTDKCVMYARFSISPHNLTRCHAWLRLRYVGMDSVALTDHRSYALRVTRPGQLVLLMSTTIWAANVRSNLLSSDLRFRANHIAVHRTTLRSFTAQLFEKSALRRRP